MNFLYLNADTMGTGPDAALSKKLLLLFLEKLAASAQRIDLIGCVNSAVFLTTQEGAALESLKTLQQRGAKIASCGTCLDHYGLQGALKIGAVGSMADTVEAMARAEKILRPC